jgi:metal-responsive CopG/Arc/MetJ family transcriptional regulator
MDYENMSAEPKDKQISFFLSSKMYEEIEDVVAKNGWRRSAFIRVAIAKELDRLNKKAKRK